MGSSWHFNLMERYTSVETISFVVRRAISKCRRVVSRNPLAAGVILGLASCWTSARADNLYVGNNVSRFSSSGRLIDVKSSVLRFDAASGAYVDTFVASGSGNAYGFRGLVFDANRDLIAVDQNVGQPTNGEVLRYRGADGVFLGALVPEPAAPYAPRGAVLSPDRQSLYVADMGDFGPNCESLPGDIYRYDATSGQFVDLLSAPEWFGDFHPRGLVFGPDGMLYATDFGNPCVPRSGSVLRFNPDTGELVDEFVPAESGDLHWPEGLAFSPSGDLYAISGRNGPNEVGQIQRFDGLSGDLVESIDLSDPDDELSATAQALLFGPNGALYVPIENRQLSDLQAGVERVVSGEIRRYDLTTNRYDTLVAPGGPLKDPWFITFENTDPATLAYVETEPTLPGDFDGNGQLDAVDIDQLTNQIVAGSNDARFDLNDDAVVDLEDHRIWVSDLKPTWYGDADLDGSFDSSDLTQVFIAGQYEDDIEGNSGWSQGDWTGDKDFTSSDLVAAFADGGYDRGPKSSAMAVPEPTSLLLLTGALVGLFACCARRPRTSEKRP